MDYHKIMDRLRKFRDDRDWAQFHNPKDLALALTVEASELQEKFLRLSKEESFDKALKDSEVGNELADVINTAFLLADCCDIDLEKTLLSKIEHNEAKYPIEKAKWKRTKYNEL